MTGNEFDVYDYAREEWEAENEARISTRRIGGQVYDERDVPSREDVEVER